MRAAIPTLLRELQTRWPVDAVSIEARPVWRANPMNPAEIIAHRSFGIAISFKSGSVPLFGRNIIAEKVAAHVRRWITMSDATQVKAFRNRKQRSQTSSALSSLTPGS